MKIYFWKNHSALERRPGESSWEERKIARRHQLGGESLIAKGEISLNRRCEGHNNRKKRRVETEASSDYAIKKMHNKEGQNGRRRYRKRGEYAHTHLLGWNI